MAHLVLLYGATGYSGRLIAAEAARAGMTDSAPDGCRFVLAGRDGAEVSRLAAELGMDHRVFRLDDRDAVVRGLDGIDVVVNAAGPFALTANHLARAALAAGCHYVDINGEPEVYLALDDLGRNAIHRGRAIVSSAGYNAAASDLLLSVALQRLRALDDADRVIELGAIRFAFSCITGLSRGSAETMLRSLREQVTVIRRGEVLDLDGNPHKAHVIWHEPVGRLERTFDFLDVPPVKERSQQVSDSDSGVASAINLVDTLAARTAVDHAGVSAQRIESYVQIDTVGRLAYQLAPFVAPLAGIPLVRDVGRLQLMALPVGPTPEERAADTGLLVLEIEDPFQARVVHWAWHTPNSYDFTAQVVVEVARKVAGSDRSGWWLPSEILQPTTQDLEGRADYLRGCRLAERRG